MAQHPMAGEKYFTNTVIPIQLRPDTTVYVQGIPHDLTQDEAQRIGRIIAGYVLPEKIIV